MKADRMMLLPTNRESKQRQSRCHFQALENGVVGVVSSIKRLWVLGY